MGYNVPIVAKPDLQLTSEEEIVSDCVNKLIKYLDNIILNQQK